MYHDEILEEVWRNRDAYVAKHRHNLDEILKDMVRRQEKPLPMIVDRRKGKKSRRTKP